jgi:hypothetical protein
MGAAVESVGGGEQARASLFLGDVGQRVVTNVTRREAGGMTVERSLPFLRLDSEFRDEEGRPGRIRDVRVALDGDTPRLVLDLVYEDEEVDIVVEVDEPPPVAVVEGSPHLSRPDATIPWGRAPEDRAAPVALEVASSRPRRRDSTVPWFGDALCSPGRVTIEETASNKKDRDAVVTFSIAETRLSVHSAPTQRLSAVTPAGVDEAIERGPTRAAGWAASLATALVALARRALRWLADLAALPGAGDDRPRLAA